MRLIDDGRYTGEPRPIDPPEYGPDENSLWCVQCGEWFEPEEIHAYRDGEPLCTTCREVCCICGEYLLEDDCDPGFDDPYYFGRHYYCRNCFAWALCGKREME